MPDPRQIQDDEYSQACAAHKLLDWRLTQIELGVQRIQADAIGTAARLTRLETGQSSMAAILGRIEQKVEGVATMDYVRSENDKLWSGIRRVEEKGTSTALKVSAIVAWLAAIGGAASVLMKILAN